MQLATFVLAILQIAKDVLWFCMIVLILVIAFSQMFFTVLAPDSCSLSSATNSTDESTACAQSEYFLTTYLLLMFQEFDREKFTTAFSVVLVVVYSFIVVLVMLNVLIAVASDSYEKCLVRSNNLFGRARVMMIAELVCFQHLLRRNTDQNTASSAQLYRAWWSANWRVSGWSRASVLFFASAILVLVAWVAGELIVVLTGPRYGILAMSLISITVTCSLFFGILSFLSSESCCQGCPTRSEEGNNSLGGGWFQRSMLQVLGSSGDSSNFSDWKGRLLYLKEEMTRLSQETRRHIAERAKTIEHGLEDDISEMRASVACLREDMKADSERLRATLMEVYRTIKHMEKK